MSLSFRHLGRAVALGCTLAATVSLGITRQSQTVSQGVYTEEQARRGQAIYKDSCSSCHGEMLEGRLGPPLTGDNFVADWGKDPLSELAGKIRNTMPQGKPGSISSQQVADIVAYLLQAGKFPAGRAELPADETALKRIAWSAGSQTPAKTAPGTVQGPVFPPA